MNKKEAFERDFPRRCYSTKQEMENDRGVYYSGFDARDIEVAELKARIKELEEVLIKIKTATIGPEPILATLQVIKDKISKVMEKSNE